MELKIEKGVPIPAKKGGGDRTGVGKLLKTMEVNDVVRIPVSGKRSQASNILNNARQATKGSGRKFVTRKLDDNTIGIWRVE